MTSAAANNAMRRKWKTVTVAPSSADPSRSGPALDGKLVKLPSGSELAVSSPALAQALADEWAAIAPDAPLTPADLPLTRITGNRLDRIAPHMDGTRAALFKYGIDDALSYHSDKQPPEALGKALKWADGQGLRPTPTEGLMPVEQPDDYKRRLTRILESKNPDELATLGVLAPALGSLLIPLALLDGAITPAEAISLGTADERAQLAEWGHDDELAKRIKDNEQDVHDALKYHQLTTRN
ncbi:ATP12 chaperone protein [Formicincola oecophyllae]|uniref:ATP12 chaperone protein n=1 Tax=Formicincola oecophyllae TaxID=2558361 RepID=A0A4Y6UBI8_9PROT|nr:ATP12 family protein [Formicincola oecophyllae]QDH13761.1 ATP12 chaperone protein [Formicincola oecophyllae]